MVCLADIKFGNLTTQIIALVEDTFSIGSDYSSVIAENLPNVPFAQ